MIRARLVLVTGIVFVVAGIPKFAAYHWEVETFARFGLPVPEAWVVAAGSIELVCGLLLIARRWVKASSALLGTTMAVAIVVSGIGHGDIIPSLTLAPALLAACIFIIAT